MVDKKCVFVYILAKFAKGRQMTRLQDNPKYKSLLKDFYLSGQVVFDFLDLKRPDQMGLSAFWSQFAKKGLPALECLAEELNAFYGAEIDYQPVLTNSPVDADKTNYKTFTDGTKTVYKLKKLFRVKFLSGQ